MTSKFQKEEYLQSYEARFKLRSDNSEPKNEADDFSIDEEDLATDDEKALVNNNVQGGKKLNWAERKLHWFKKRQNKRGMIITSTILMLVGSLMLILTAAIRFTMVRAESTQEVMLNLYYLFFGVLLIIA